MLLLSWVFLLFLNTILCLNLTAFTVRHEYFCLLPYFFCVLLLLNLFLTDTSWPEDWKCLYCIVKNTPGPSSTKCLTEGLKKVSVSAPPLLLQLTGSLILYLNWTYDLYEIMSPELLLWASRWLISPSSSMLSCLSTLQLSGDIWKRIIQTLFLLWESWPLFMFSINCHQKSRSCSLSHARRKRVLEFPQH